MQDQKKSKQAPQSKEPEMVLVILPRKAEGVFAFTEYKIPLEILEKHGEVTVKSNPDIFAIIKDQLTHKVMDIFGL